MVDERTLEVETQKTELEKQRTFLSQVINSCPNFIFVKNREGRFSLVNQALAQAYHRTAEEIIGKCDAELSPASTAVKAAQRDDLRLDLVILGVEHFMFHARFLEQVRKAF